MSIPIYFPAQKKDLPKLPDEPITEFWIVFSDSEDWIRYFLKQNFSHCYVLTKDKFNWMILNPERLYLRTEIAPYPADEDLIKIFIKPHETVLKISFMPRHTTTRFGICGMFSCVTLVRYLLGLRIKALTPYSLYKKLVKLDDKKMNKMRLSSVEIIQKGI